MRIVNATDGYLTQALALRLTALREICQLPSSYQFSEDFCQTTLAYMAHDTQTTCLTLDAMDTPVACATICYTSLLPTFDHPTGHRAHFMNVYTVPSYRRQGLSRTMLLQLIEEARGRGVTAITLDATEAGCPLYASLGFVPNEEGMIYLMNGGSSHA